MRHYPAGCPLDEPSSITLYARSPYDMGNETLVNVPIAALIDVYPDVNEVFFPYDVVLVMDIDSFKQIDKSLFGQQSLKQAAVKINVPYGDINTKAIKIAELLSENEVAFQIRTRLDEEKNIEDNLHSTTFFFNVLILFFGALGLLQAVNSINMSIQTRKRDLAILRSIGTDTAELRQVFMWEATAYSILPIVLSLPVSFVATLMFKLLFKNLSLHIALRWIPYINIMILNLPLIIVIFAVYSYHSYKINKMTSLNTIY